MEINATLPSPPQFALPPLSALSFAPILFLLTLLLQPAVPSRISRPLRLALFLPAVVLAGTSTFRYRIEPVEWAIGANFRFGISSPFFVMRAIEWGLLAGKEREKENAWIGFTGKHEQELHIEKKVGRADDVGKSNSTAMANGGSAVVVKRTSGTAAQQNGVVAPRPVHPVPVSNILPSSSTSSSATSTPPQLPTPAPSPPFSAVQPPSITESATPSSRLTPLTASKTAALRAEQRHHPLRVLADATHLLTTLRGIGYVWGPPSRSLPPPEPSHGAFLHRQAIDFVRAHLISTLSLAAQVHHRDGKLAPLVSSLFSRLPFLPFTSSSAASLEPYCALLSRLLVGVSLHSQMLIGFAGANITFLALAYATNAVLDLAPERWGWTWRAIFDAREYPPLFDSPFEKMGDGGVSSLWGKRWHALFRSSFNALGFKPAVRLAKSLGLPSTVGKLLGAVLVFGLSAWMHWQALFSARYSLSPSPAGLAFASSLSLPLSSLYPAPYSSLSFVERHGTFLFFLAQPIAVLLETAWTVATKRRIRGWAGRMWTTLWIVVLGQAVVGRSWLALGLAHGLPPVSMWTWKRWVVPVFALAPMPAFMRFPVPSP
ncbi:hypothetical protein JCM8547_000273 [Rhodosporidiobolus lusitaniae]